ncbi:ATP-dependent DNA helicase, RecQ family [Thiorhodovibrio frisius]|uniref:DNA 3'-5' helicase n=2 Tax=Thiorhodovibrio frisius TaxID=631362 RepID=H8Z7W8_9GAMM|nr:ATP-dependent DNA helicase, RecQ family [Thiorhodovibrio frisius]WPL22035.1 ATP-dependent DNA helicase RecQ [Thiorhodovibrio frisius]
MDASVRGSIDPLLQRSLFLDLETGADGAVHKIGAIRDGREFRRQGAFDLHRALADLQSFAGDAEFVVGHNLLGHDLPTLRALAPALGLLGRRIIDTLYLSPLAFPQNPYHRLVKDYKLVRDSVADPVADCRLAAQILREQFDVLVRRVSAGEADLIGVFQFCFRGATLLDDNPTGGDGMAAVFRLLSGDLPNVMGVRDTLLARWQGRACTTTAPRLILDHVRDVNLRPVIAYTAAWLQVAGGDSVLPPWVRHRFPATRGLLKALRETPCGDPACRWCRETHDPVRQLKRWFGFDAFRSEPAAADGSSLQQAVATDGIADQSLLAILPTGGGKSLCFQLPGLVRHFRRGTLTVVISPLQALMKDQVDNLVKKTGTTSAAAIYGMLTPPERGDVMERVRLGDVAILYISPEQLRNRSVGNLLASREIGCWVFDEAHCLSKWGHDFRPDYLYAGRFIRTLAERQQAEIPPVACFTATAKPDVIAEILAYFRDELGLQLRAHEGGVERDNLAFEVQTVGKHEKDERIHVILAEHLTQTIPGAPDDPNQSAGAAVVYASRRKRTEELADTLMRHGWAVAAFHAGIEAPEKKRIQNAFVAGELQVICATNAFGMGVDKEDVRVVIHADIPGSLENYIQEAGRAGRDRKPALCVLLYDEQDIEAQFGLEAMSELSRRDIAEILRGLRRAKRDQEGRVVATSAELLRDEQLRLDFDTEGRDADTRVRIAIAWLERAGLVQRDDNRTGVFQGRPAVPSLEAAERKIRGLGLSKAQQARWLAIMELMLNAEPDEGITADDLARLPAFAPEADGTAPAWDRGETPGQRVLRTLHDMAGAGLLNSGPQLTAFVRHKVKDHSALILERVARLERAMLDALREQEPDPESGAWLPLSLRRLNQHLLDQGQPSNPETLRTLLKGLSLDGRGLAGARGSLDLRQSDRDHYRLKLHRDWPTLIATAERRRAVAGLILRKLLAKLPADAGASSDLLVSFGTDELTQALRDDLTLAAEVRDPLAAMERGLMFLHEHGAIILHGGFAVFRSAMTVQLLPEAKGRRYSKAQYQPLAQHYGERVFQIHVMDQYARLGAEMIRQALGLVTAYFTLGKAAFVKRFFADRREMLTRATTAESFHAIVDALGNPAQTEIVAAPQDGNRLVLAGPGSGKTRVIVHRCAYLLRVLRVPGHRILVLCFNRSAALELRRRLADLVGDGARGVTVQTYHGFAMRLTGHSYAERLANGAGTGAGTGTGTGPDFDGLIAEAVDLLEGRVELPGIAPDSTRERLLAGYRHILVDEYQDVDADQYRLVSAIAGRTADDDSLTLLAVGDDDQNIYAFRGASVDYIRRFQQDYDAELHYLVENYRSSAHIIAAANALIAHNGERMKQDHPIRIDRRRKAQPAGGRWAGLDGHAKGRVLLLRVADPARQAAALVARIQELQRLGDGSWSDFAVLARQHELLAPIRALCEHHHIPVRLPGDLPALHRIREIGAFLAALKQRQREPLTAETLTGLLPQRPSPWRDLLASLIDDWTAEAGTAAVPAAEIAEFCWETLAEQRRERSASSGGGSGVLLSTLHGAKGLEFPHVLIIDGGWDGSWGHNPADEDERRLFYVGMTRARETLTLLELAPGKHPHLPLLDGDWLLRAEPAVETPPPEILARRYTRLTPADLDLGFAGRQAPDAPIHGQLAALNSGDALTPGRDGEHLTLMDAEGIRVARLSKRAAAVWCPRIEMIETIRVEALMRRDRAQDTQAFANHSRCEHWEVPLVEICWRTG